MKDVCIYSEGIENSLVKDLSMKLFYNTIHQSFDVHYWL